MGPNWTIISEDDMFRGKAVPGGDIVNKSMSDEVAHQLTKANTENEKIKKVIPFMATLNFGVMDNQYMASVDLTPIKFHPGAVRAWKKLGIKYHLVLNHS